VNLSERNDAKLIIPYRSMYKKIATFKSPGSPSILGSPSL